MFTNLKKLGLAAGVSLVALTGYAAAETPAISEISVGTTYAAAEDSNAAQTFPQIATDLQTAIAQRVPTSTDGSDPRIKVDIRKVALNGNTMINDAGEFNELEGVVSFESQNRDIGDKAFPVNVTAVMGDQEVPPGFIVIPPSTSDYYTVMLNAFADKVAMELENVNTAGSGVSK